MQRFTAVFIAKVIILCCYLPVLFLNRELEKQGRTGSFFSVIAEKNKVAGWIVFVLLSGVLFFFAAITLGKLDFYVTNTLMRDALSFSIIFISSTAVLYCVHKGLSPVARLGSVSFVLYMFLVFAVIVVLSDKIKLDFLYPDLFDNLGNLPKSISGELGKNAEIFIFAILTDKISGKPNRTILFYLPFSLIAVLFLSFINITVFGPYLNEISFPNYMISSLLDIKIFERLDGVDVAIWTVSAIIKVSLMYICMESMLEKLTNGKTAKNTAMILVAVGAAIAMFSANHHNFIIVTYSFGFEITAILLFLIISPIAAIAIIRGEKGKRAL
jgi:hypothetical protein